MTVKLPDVSEFQAPASGNAPDWAGIKSQNGGAAIIRVGYGNAHLDEMFGSNRATIKSLKFGFCGLYQYLVADQDVVSQADAFIKWVGPSLNAGEIPVLDLEEGSGDQSSRASQWFGLIDQKYHLASLPLGQRSWLYSGEDFAVSAGLAPIFRSARRTWVAAYQASASGLLPHTLWQSTNGQTGANLTDWSGCGYCDTSLYEGTLASLSALGWHPSTHQSMPLEEEEMQIQNDKKYGAVAFRGGQYTYIAFFCDPGGEGKTPNVLRVAPFSGDSHDFVNITTVTIGPATQKVTVALPPNCNGISFQRQDDESNWATIAYNLGA
jgi:Glycosyl hydrolases family 25